MENKIKKNSGKKIVYRKKKGIGTSVNTVSKPSSAVSKPLAVNNVSKPLAVNKPSSAFIIPSSGVSIPSSGVSKPLAVNSTSPAPDKKKENPVSSASNGAVSLLLIVAIFLISIPFLVCCSSSFGVSSLFSSASGISQGSVNFCEDFWLGFSDAIGLECGEVYQDIVNFFEDIEETFDNWESIVSDSLNKWTGQFDKWGDKIEDWTHNVNKWEKKFKKWF